MAMTPQEIIAVVQHFDAGGEVLIPNSNPESNNLAAFGFVKLNDPIA